MNNLDMFLVDMKLLTSRFLTTSAVHSAEFEKLVALICSYLGERYILRFRLIFLMGTITATIL